MLHAFQLLNPVQTSAPWIREFQVTQERVDHIVVRIVPVFTPAPHELAAWRAPTTALLGPGVSVEVELVEAFRDEPGRKFRVFRSLVGPSG